MARIVRTLPIFAALAVIHTWPLMAAPGYWSRNDNADALLNEWILAWVARTLVLDPVHLFDANIFYPEPRALTFSESLIVQGTMGLPLYWLGASPVLLVNVVIIAGLTLTGWTMCLVIERWTGCLWAGIVAGSLAAFNTHTLTRMAQVQAMHVEFLPLALLALDRVVTRGRIADGARLGLWFALQGLCSGYLLFMSAVSIALSWLGRIPEVITRRPRRALYAAAVSALVAAVMLAPFLWPYYLSRRDQGLVRDLGEVALYSASPLDYLSTAARLHFALWSRRFYGPDPFFPGVLPVALVLVAVLTGTAWRDARARMLLLSGLAGFALSLGSNLPGYALLHAWIPLLQGLRAAARFGYLAMFGVAGLSGFGLAWLLSRPGRLKRSAALAGLTAAIVVNAENLRAPIGLTPFTGIPRLYDLIAAEPDAVVVELPFPGPRDLPRNGAAVLASTRYWRPLLNGYSGFVPRSYVEHAAALADFPAPAAFDYLHRLGVRHLVVHLDPDGALDRELAKRHDLEEIAGASGLRLYRLR